jgi:hypothetical protein
MVTQGKGWIAGYKNGEALSRVCAKILYPHRAWLWSTGNSWLNGDPSSPNPVRSDFVDNVWPTDQDYIGCGPLFLNYLAYQLNYQWPAIMAAGAPTTNTHAETATILGVSNAWINFSTLDGDLLAASFDLAPAADTVRRASRADRRSISTWSGNRTCPGALYAPQPRRRRHLAHGIANPTVPTSI